MRVLECLCRFEMRADDKDRVLVDLSPSNTVVSWKVISVSEILAVNFMIG